MKITTYLVLGLLALNLTPAWGQNNFATLQLTGQATALNQADTTKLTKFNLKFSGGTPADLVAAIEQATGKPLNVIIPTEAANTQLPPLKMDNVTTPQLFSALEAASYKRETRLTYSSRFSLGGDAYQIINIDYGFKTDGTPTDDSIWYFHVENPPAPPPAVARPPVKVCRFYQLAPYLNSGLTVDDITTAIQAGWKMMDETSTPQINFHKETKLLIAVGEEQQLQVISDVLSQLQTASSTSNPDSHHFQERLNTIIKRTSQPPSDTPVPITSPATPSATNKPDAKP